MAGTHLLERLDSPNGMSRNYTYEPHRYLIASLNDKRGNTAVVNRSYTYNALGIPTNRTIQRQGTTRNDTFTHNDRSELTAATMGADSYAYDYDNIGNRKTAQEVENEFTYESNALNQYTQITENDTPFTPAFDLDGNQTRIKTVTGIWTATYNALNRPVRFENAAAGVVITSDYDYMGRRVFKKVETNNATTSHLRFMYRGYLQIAALDLTRATQNAIWLITWDPTEPVATRPLAIQQSGTWYTYGIDLPKNITEVYGTNGYIVTAYTYSPYGLVTATGNVTQPIQWSSEFVDTETNVVLFNYRYFNSTDGAWLTRDFAMELSSFNLYSVKNPYSASDILGLFPLFGLDINLDVSFTVEGCVMPFPAFPLVKFCLSAANKVSAGTCCSKKKLKTLTRVEFSVSAGVQFSTDLGGLSISFQTNASLGFIEKCPKSTSPKLDGAFTVSVTIPGVEISGEYSINDGFDFSVGTAWTLQFSAQISGSIKAKGTTVR